MDSSGETFLAVLFLQALHALGSRVTLGRDSIVSKWLTNGVIICPVYILWFLNAFTGFAIDFGSALIREMVMNASFSNSDW